MRYVRDRTWFVRLYRQIIPELKRGDYRPYKRTNHALSHLYHDIQGKDCVSVDCGTKSNIAFSHAYHGGQLI